MLKKLLTIVAVLALCAVQSKVSLGLDMNDLQLVLGSKGPDMYADGTPVLDGENYVLIWIKDGYTFAGMMSNGTLVDSINNKIVGKLLPKAKGYPESSHCESFHTYIPARMMVDEYKGGYFGFYLLDTRRFDADGNVSVGVKPVKSVNGIDLVQEHAETIGGQVDPSLVNLKSTVPPEGISMATITSIIPATAIDDPVVIVNNTDDSIVYCVEYGVDMESIGENLSSPQNGDSSKPVSFKIKIPQESGRAFFRLIRKK